MDMYIVVKEDVPADLVPLVCSHASLSAYLRHQDNDYVQDWVRHSFKKKICKANEVEFNNCKSIPDVEVIVESRLDNREVAVVLLPRPEFPKFVKFLRMYKV